MNTVDSIIESFGRLTDFGRACGFTENAGQRAWNMRQRGRIPSAHWPALLRAAEHRGMLLTMDMLVEAEMHAVAERRTVREKTGEAA